MQMGRKKEARGRKMADSIKCPNCSGNLIFDIGRQKLFCEYCLSAFVTEELEDTISIKEADEEPEGILEEGLKITCNACGAQLVTEKNSVVTYCSFCGSPAFIKERLSERFAPHYVIPFQIDRDEAVKKFLRWCNGGRWAPCEYTSEKTISKISGIYLPFWLFDIDCRIDISAAALKNGRPLDLVRKIETKWRKLPFLGSKSFNEDLMKAIEPYKLESISVFHPGYLHGFMAECYDTEGEAVKERAATRVKEYIDEEFRVTVSTSYTDVKKTADRSEWKYEKVRYAMFPVWLLRYEYGGKVYEFAINGQTGAVSGSYPISLPKVILLFATVFTACAALARLILALFLGGLF